MKDSRDNSGDNNPAQDNIISLSGIIRRQQHNVELEARIIGALLLDQRRISSLELVAEDFAFLPYQYIFAVISRRTAAGEPISAAMFMNDPALTSGNATWTDPIALARAAETIPPHLLADYAAVIRDYSIRRALIEGLEQASIRAYDCTDSTAESICQDLLASVHQLQAKSGSAWTNISNVNPTNIEWLWRNRLLLGRINIISGMGDVGKDVLCCNIAAHVTTGRDWPDGAPGCEPGIVGIIAPEDDPSDTIRPRLEAAGADVSKVKIWTRGTATPDHVAGLRLLIVSPLITIMGNEKDINREQDAREFLTHWQGNLRGCTCIGTAHLSKKNDLQVVQRILGASGIANFARSVWSLQRDDEDKTIRLFMRLKANLSPDETDGLRFGIRHVGPYSQSICCTWMGSTDKAPDAVMTAANSRGNRHDSGGQQERGSVLPWLMAYLQEHGETPKAAVMIAASDAGFRTQALEKAAQRSNGAIKSRREGLYGTAYWSLTGA